MSHRAKKVTYASWLIMKDTTAADEQQMKRYVGHSLEGSGRTEHRNFCPHELGCATSQQADTFCNPETLSMLLFKSFYNPVSSYPPSLEGGTRG